MYSTRFKRCDCVNIVKSGFTYFELSQTLINCFRVLAALKYDTILSRLIRFCGGLIRVYHVP